MLGVDRFENKYLVVELKLQVKVKIKKILHIEDIIHYLKENKRFINSQSIDA